MSTISSDDLRAILAGCEGVTRGPWVYSRNHDLPLTPNLFEVGSPTRGVASRLTALNAAHIARLDPQTVASICRELLSLRESHPIEDGEGWRDISTAPKDGTELILLFDGGVWSGRWVQDEGWFETNNHPTDSWGFGELRPTMWRHYPAAPSNPGTSKVENSHST